MLRAAFRDAHGARLHGFALILTLGDEQLAATLAADALDAGVRHADALRHPERAAAWLRGRVLRKAPPHARRAGPDQEERRTALAALGVDEASYDILQRFSVQQRATLVAGEIEGLAPLDLELVLGSSASSVRRGVSDIRRLFLQRRMEAARETPSLVLGPLEERVQGIADTVLARARR